jgi:hypothetical protein
MTSRLFLLILLLFTLRSAYSQELTLTDTISTPGITIPSPEEFVNAVIHTVIDSSFSHYYLIAGTDTCYFTKYEYDEWAKYGLKEFIPFPILNELSEKVYLSRYPYFWKQDRLQQAICITRHQGDSILRTASLIGSSKIHGNKKQRRLRRQLKQQNKDRLAQDNFVFSFSLPQFTDDGQYAVIDLNFTCGVICGDGSTYIFHHTATGWKLIGKHNNWAS